ncbi:MAG TPA: hypothetical protein ENK33_10990 [Desulfobacterales bacterium]|nr:hypothetical protein [Desulfobacterales bacterium]
MMLTTKKIAGGLLAATFVLAASTAPSFAADKPTADFSVDALSKYVWRGFELSRDSLVLQPSATVEYKGFSANIWGNLDTDTYSGSTNNWTETDMTLSYTRSLGMVDLTGGYIYYGLDNADDTQEVFLSAALNTILTPTLSIYRDYDSFPGWYITLGISHSIPIKDDITLDLGAQIGYLSADEASSYGEVENGVQSSTQAYNAFHDGLLTASMTFPINQYVSITPKLNYSFALTDDARDLIKVTSLDYNNSTHSGGHDNFLYGGINVDLSF